MAVNVFEYTKGYRTPENLNAFIDHVKEHGYGVLHLFNDKQIDHIQAKLVNDLFKCSGQGLMLQLVSFPLKECQAHQGQIQQKNIYTKSSSKSCVWV